MTQSYIHTYIRAHTYVNVCMCTCMCEVHTYVCVLILANARNVSSFACFHHHPPDMHTSDVHLFVSKPSSIAVAPSQSSGRSARWLPVTKSSNSSASVRAAPVTCTPLGECFPSVCRLMISHRVRKSLQCKHRRHQTAETTRLFSNLQWNSESSTHTAAKYNIMYYRNPPDYCTLECDTLQCPQCLLQHAWSASMPTAYAEQVCCTHCCLIA